MYRPRRPSSRCLITFWSRTTSIRSDFSTTGCMKPACTGMASMMSLVAAIQAPILTDSLPPLDGILFVPRGLCPLISASLIQSPIGHRPRVAELYKTSTASDKMDMKIVANTTQRLLWPCRWWHGGLKHPIFLYGCPS